MSVYPRIQKISGQAKTLDETALVVGPARGKKTFCNRYYIVAQQGSFVQILQQLQHLPDELVALHFAPIFLTAQKSRPVSEQKLLVKCAKLTVWIVSPYAHGVNGWHWHYPNPGGCYAP